MQIRDQLPHDLRQTWERLARDHREHRLDKQCEGCETIRLILWLADLLGDYSGLRW